MNTDIVNNIEVLQSMFGHEQTTNYERLGIKYNPFTRSGAANINDDDEFVRNLIPLTDEVNRQVLTFLANATQENPLNPRDKFQSCVIMGDYGSGKTQLLMYIRSVINFIASNPNVSCRPYVIYVDNPGVTLLDLIGRIVNEIGEENVRKYLWNFIISEIRLSAEYKTKLQPYLMNLTSSLFKDQNELYDPYSEENSKSYKLFLNAFIRQINSFEKRKKFDADFREIIMLILQSETKDSNVANYFYEFISSDYGVNKAWEGLTNGTLKQLSGKEARIIGQIVSLVKKQGYTDFFILVDEFEDITEGRLSKVQLDNYIYNLRTLLDEQREWALFFSMNPVAYTKLRSVSPPLADRISSEQIVLNGLTNNTARKLVENYVKVADGSGINPFTEEAITYILKKSDGNTRQFVVLCYKLVEELKRSGQTKIDETFVISHILERAL